MKASVRFLCVVLLTMVVNSAAAQGQFSVGDVTFANSGNDAAQTPFLRGLALLHNFEYDAAAEAFREAQAVAPDFAMAYWGEAMTYNHTVWQEQDQAAALSVLNKLAPTAKRRLRKAETARERAYLGAIEKLYGDGDKRARDREYSAAMQALAAAYPEDVDAQAFYALSLLGLAHDGREIPLYMRAAAVLEELFPSNRRHPGVLHYLIHSYDDPAHAPLGLRAARLYGDVAPRAGHALHMTSHIFVAMGMWDEVISANQQAITVVNEQRAERGDGPRACGHYNEWLVYGFLQRAEYAEAENIIAKCRTEALAELEDNPVENAIESYWSRVFSYSDIELRYIVDHNIRPEGQLNFPDGKYLISRVYHAYGDVLLARGDATALTAAEKSLRAGIAAMAKHRADENQSAASGDRHFDIILLQASGLLALAAGETAPGLDDLRAAAALEDAMPVEFGPPAIAKPSYELLAEELVRLGRIAEARAAYEKAIDATPGRKRATDGLAAL